MTTGSLTSPGPMTRITRNEVSPTGMTGDGLIIDTPGTRPSRKARDPPEGREATLVTLADRPTQLQPPRTALSSHELRRTPRQPLTFIMCFIKYVWERFHP
jgi:hypothetical protein